MEGLNRIIFLVLGLVAVVIFFAVLTGRINLKGKLPTFSDGTTKVTITPTASPAPSSTSSSSNENKNSPSTSKNKPYNTNSKTNPTSKPITTIPATGISEFFFALVFVLLAIGVYMKKWQ
ncbi:MAG TPA: hypothetical protein VJB63_01255 [Patescibacteria group bacterium]|nr:hypothetical protein [Patescibacteria group bacterium]